MASCSVCSDREQLEAKLKDWGIDYDTIEHPEVFTVEQALPHLTNVDGVFAKNLFLKDKKKQLYLFCAVHDVDIKLSDLAKLTGASGGLRFADESVLKEKLGVAQGSVTLFGILNDTNNDVKLVIDRTLTDGTYSKILFHPLVNTASLAITHQSLNKIVQYSNHSPVILDIAKSV